MREILFRGKTLTGKWVEGAYYKQKLFYGDKEDADVIITSEENLTFDQALDFAICTSETIGQYTGLTDKYGTKIFEGDILANEKNNIARVTWYEEHCAFLIYSITENKVYWLYNNDFSEIEVIGNIHDNPELLKRGNAE